VFLGGALALSLVSLLGAFLGGLLGCYLPTKYVQIGAGLLFIGVGALMVIRNLLP